LACLCTKVPLRAPADCDTLDASGWKHLLRWPQDGEILPPLVSKALFHLPQDSSIPVSFLLATAVSGQPIGHQLPLWSVMPFGLMLLGIPVLPLVAERFWEHNHNKAILSGLFSLPVAIWIARLEPLVLAHTAHEYAAFIILLGALYVIFRGYRGAGRPGPCIGRTRSPGRPSLRWRSSSRRSSPP
jgi:hypothetical protein